MTQRLLKNKAVFYKEDDKIGNEYKSQQKKSNLHIWKKVMTVVKHWSRLPREVAETLKIIKINWTRLWATSSNFKVLPALNGRLG